MPIPAGPETGDRLATVDDLANLLNLGDDVDADRAGLLLECATAVVQAITGQRIVEVTDDEVTLDLDGWDGGPYLVLPERPVTEVSAVAIGETTVADYSTQLRRGRLWRADGWRSTLVGYPNQPTTATITYTHGYPAGHQRLQLARSAVLTLASTVYGNPEGAVREQIDDYAVAYEAMSARMDASPFLSRALRKQYSRPAGSVPLVAVTA